MRAALPRFAAFVAGLLVIAVLLHLVLIGALRRRETGDHGVWNRVVDGKVDARVLISGSSRSLVGVDARRLAELCGAPAYNISIDGARLEAQLALLQTYLRHNAAPSLLVQSLDVGSLEPQARVYKPSLYLPYLGEPELYAYTSSVERRFRAMRYLPLYGFAVEKDALFEALYGLSGREDARRDDRRNGSLLRDLGWDGSFERYALENPEGVRYAVTPAGIGTLTRIVTLAREHGVPLVLLYPPDHGPSSVLVRNRGEILDRYAEFAKRHGLEFWDYSAHPIGSRREFFYNSMHLNLPGALRFTDELAARVRERLAVR